MANKNEGEVQVGEGEERISLGGEKDEELVELETNIAKTEARNKLALAERRFDSFEAYDKAIAENEAKATTNALKSQELGDRENAIKVAEQTLDAKEKELKDEDSRLVIAQERVQRELLNAKDRIALVDENHKKARENEDRKRGERRSQELSTLDRLAQTLYNAHPQSITNRVRENAIVDLEILMKGFGLKPEFNKLNKYIPILQRTGWIGIEIKPEGRDKPVVVDEASMPENVRKALTLCRLVYKACYQDKQGLGIEFCRETEATLNKTVALVENKTDEEITGQLDGILSLFKKMNIAIIGLADKVQHYQPDALTRLMSKINHTPEPYYEWENWLADKNIELEKLLDISVSSNAKIPMRGGN